jgi:hypothetical protein
MDNLGGKKMRSCFNENQTARAAHNADARMRTENVCSDQMSVCVCTPLVCTYVCVPVLTFGLVIYGRLLWPGPRLRCAKNMWNKVTCVRCKRPPRTPH